jgi:hypothetical protein
MARCSIALEWVVLVYLRSTSSAGDCRYVQISGDSGPEWGATCSAAYHLATLDNNDEPVIGRLLYAIRKCPLGIAAKPLPDTAPNRPAATCPRSLQPNDAAYPVP